MSKKSAFFVTPIGQENSAERDRSDKILEYVLSPALGESFELVRADHVTSIGSINHDIIERLVNSDLVIADLTGTNANVMYEIGIRHSFNLPIVQIAQKGQKLPFDLGTERTIFFDLTDIREVEVAKRTLLATVNTAMSQSYSGPVDRTLKRSAVFPKDRTIAEAIETLSEKIEDVETSIQSMLVFDVAVDAKLSEGDAERLRHVYDILSSVRPYEAERMFDTLRRLSQSK
ncbi:MAG: hypothetical protein MUF74_02370 [Cypionkella sp.]|jgi:hypothetical protein|nr:hypothetical protein [Cypionkella sp.]